VKVSEFLDGLEAIWPQLKIAGLVVVAAIALIALAAAVYTVKAAGGPVLAVARWMFACGSEPNDIVSGISFGARMLVWAALVGVAFWFLFQ
jgi:hypothetical protein